MENRIRQHNRQMLDRRKDSKRIASIVASSDKGKRDAARKHVTQRTERSELQTDNKRQDTALVRTENWYARFVGTQATPPDIAIRGKEMVSRANRSHTENKPKRRHAIRDER